jgi:GT2 family glycosyltransferase
MPDERGNPVSRSVTVVSVLWNSADLIPALADTLNGLSDGCDIILVDNNSTDDTADLAARLIPDARILSMPQNGGFGTGNNRAIEVVSTPFTLLLNSDARIESESLNSLNVVMSQCEKTAAVQPALKIWDWPLLAAGEGVSMTRYGEGYDINFLHFSPGATRGDPVRVPGVTAAVSLWRTAALREVSGFDEEIFMYFEDVDLSMRLASLGWRFSLATAATALHRAGASSSREKAAKWELESSVYLTRRYFGSRSCTLPPYWWKRELRIRAHGIIRRIPWKWRIGSVRRACSLPCTPVRLSGEVLSMLQPRPMELPLTRSALCGNLDPDGILEAGPGFSKRNGRLFITQYGCILSKAQGMISVELITPDRCRSGSIRNEAGDVLARFNSRPGEVVRLKTGVAPAGSKFYLSMDEYDATAEVTNIVHSR